MFSLNSTGQIQNISVNYKTQNPVITIELNERGSISSLEKLKEDKLSIEIKKWYQKRSLDANSYCWVLCDMIGKSITTEEATVTKEDVYRDAISQIGTVQAFIVEEKAFDDFKRVWERQGLGFQVKEMTRKDKCVKVLCYYGSSTYNTKEMSLLINLLVEEAQAQGLETKPQAEIDSLLKEWDKE